MPMAKTHEMLLAVAPDAQFENFRERIHHDCTQALQTPKPENFDLITSRREAWS
jgi:hypothetical protein